MPCVHGQAVRGNSGSDPAWGQGLGGLEMTPGHPQVPHQQLAWDLAPSYSCWRPVRLQDPSLPSELGAPWEKPLLSPADLQAPWAPTLVPPWES